MDQNVTDMQIAGWLINTPATDGNFKTSLAKANAATIRFAMASAQGSTKKKALEAALKKLERQGIDPDSEAALEMVEVVQVREQSVQQEQLDREQRIAECHQFIGRIQAVGMVEKLATVSSLMWLKDVKNSKLYRDLPGIETWDKFCESLGKSRRLIDEQLLNLEILGGEFLETVSSLRVGYREMKKLRQLTCDGTVTIDEAEICIGGEVIPFTPEHRDDLQAALERVIETNAKIISDKETTIKTKDRVIKQKEELIQKQEKDLVRLSDEAATAEMTAQEEAWLRKMDVLRTSFDGYMLKVDPERCELADPASERTPRMVAAYLTTLDYMRKQLLVAHDVATDLYGSVAMIPEDGWKQPEE